MARKKAQHAPADHQQENVNDPVLVPDLSKLEGMGPKIEAAVSGEMDYHDIYETICGVTDDSQDVELYNGTLGVTQAFVNSHQRPVGVLRWNSNLGSIYDNPGNVAGVRWCTGTLISNDLFITAGHCFDQTGGGWQRPRVNGTTNIIPPSEIATNMSVEFGFQRAPDGTLRTPTSIAVVALVEYRLGGLDFAIARLAGSPGTTWGFTRIAQADAAQNDMLCIIGHPAGQPKRIEAGPLTSFDGDRIRYNDIDTLGGNSGSGILRASDGRIVGIHTNGGCNAAMTGSNFGVRITALLRESPTLRSLPTGTSVIADVVATSAAADRIVTTVQADTVTTVISDRVTSAIADRVTLASQDRATSALLDRPTSPSADFRTNPALDQRGTNKAVDDRKSAGLDKQFSDRKTPGLDTQYDPGLGRVVNPAVRGGLQSAQPFVLATPHHAPVGGESIDETAEAYEQAVAEIDLAIEVLAQQIERLEAEREALIAEYQQTLGG
jgi:V8-like Glu-specific endopeptidase